MALEFLCDVCENKVKESQTRKVTIEKKGRAKEKILSVCSACIKQILSGLKQNNLREVPEARREQELPSEDTNDPRDYLEQKLRDRADFAKTLREAERPEVISPKPGMREGEDCVHYNKTGPLISNGKAYRKCKDCGESLNYQSSQTLSRGLNERPNKGVRLNDLTE